MSTITSTCSNCQQWFSAGAVHPGNYYVSLPDRPVADLEKTFGSCYLCNKMWLAFRRCLSTSSPPDHVEASLFCSPDPALLIITGKRQGVSALSPQLAWSSVTRQWTPIRLRNLLRQTAPRLQITDDPTLREEWMGTNVAFSEDRLKRARRWIDRCERKHHQCGAWHKRNRTRRPFAPTRLVFLDAANGSVRLVESQKAKLDHGVRYATLSHCWGDVDIFKLTRTNLKKLCHAISVGKLEKTFQEAIFLCRLLGFSFIWIDSLCILQDDESDWRREASMMHLVYGCSALNLAASASAGGDEGLFRPQAADLLRKVSISFDDNIFIEDALNFTGWYRKDFETSPLHGRGWVLQELFLATRTLHFTESLMWWQCKEDVQHEDDNYWLEADQHPRWTFANQGLLDPISASALSDETYHVDQLARRQTQMRASLHTRWSLIARDYSASEVTLSSDRIVALAGIASLFQELYATCGIATRCLAGCWEHELIDWLLWKRSEEAILSVRNTQEPAEVRKLSKVPTWSWMSCPAPSLAVRVTGIMNSRFKVQHLKILTITAPPSDGMLILGGGDAEITLNVKGPVFDPAADGGFCHHLCMYASSAWQQHVVWDEVPHFPSDHDLYMCVLTWSTRRPVSKFEFEAIVFKEDSGLGTHRRCGMMHFSLPLDDGNEALDEHLNGHNNEHGDWQLQSLGATPASQQRELLLRFQSFVSNPANHRALALV